MTDETMNLYVRGQYIRAHGLRDADAVAALFTPNATIKIVDAVGDSNRPLGRLEGCEAIRDAAQQMMAPHDRRAWSQNVISAPIVNEATDLSKRALTFGDGALPDAHAFREVSFDGSEPKSDVALRWDAAKDVEIPGTGRKFAAYIDRLDISGDGSHGLARDYKTGRVTKQSLILDGDKELQRCLYAFAVKALLGEHIAIGALLLYPRADVDLHRRVGASAGATRLGDAGHRCTAGPYAAPHTSR